MNHSLSPEDLEDNSNFELIIAVPYSEIKSFILNQIQKQNKLLKVFGIFQIVAAAGILTPIVYFGILAINQKALNPEINGLILGLLFAFSLLIFIHEGIHALAFLVLGKRNISFGAQWKKFLFYVESHRQVLNRPQMIVVALAPLIFISIFCWIGIIISGFNAFALCLFEIFLIHIFFCSGDIIIVSFFNKHKKNQIFTYDDREKQTTFYFKKANPGKSVAQQNDDQPV